MTWLIVVKILLYFLSHHVIFLQDFEINNLDDLCDTLKQLSTESHKYHAKRDRRHQKSSFRDILRSVQVSFMGQKDAKSQ